jgi:hypothetical protein
MTDSFRRHSRSLTAPPEHGAAVTPDDGRDLAVVTRALYVGGAGDLAVRMADGTALTFGAVPAGTLLPVRVVRVLATGTSATRVVGLW